MSMSCIVSLIPIYLVEKVLRKKEDKIYMKWLGFDNSHKLLDTQG